MSTSDKQIPWSELKKKNQTVSFEVFKYRHNLCLDCENYEAKNDMCKLCFCAMRSKSQLKISACPIGKWKEDIS